MLPLNVKEIRRYMRADEVVPFDKWIKGLKDAVGIAKVFRRLDRIKIGNLGDHKSVGEGVIELRLDVGPGYRVYCGQDGDALVILLCGGDKSSQSSDIRRAKEYWEDYRRRK